MASQPTWEAHNFLGNMPSNPLSCVCILYRISSKRSGALLGPGIGCVLPTPLLHRRGNQGGGAPGEEHSKNTRARYSSAIESEYKFEYKCGLRSDLRAPIFEKIFWGNMLPDPPSACVLMHHHQYPPIVSTFHCLCADQHMLLLTEKYLQKQKWGPYKDRGVGGSQPVLTKAFLQPAKTATICTAPCA